MLIKSGNSFLIFCIVSLLVFILNGCGCTDNSRNRLRIAVIPMGTTHEFWKAIHAGAVKASRELDVDVIWKGPLREDDRDEQIQIVETFLAAGIDALVLSPLDNRALLRPVREAKNRGIPTIVINSILDGDYISFVATDNYKGGVLAAHHLGGLLYGKGKLILVRVTELEATSTLREEGFLKTIQSEYSGITILSSNQYGGVTTESAYRTCENLLNRFPEVEAIFTPNESTTFGCLRALEDKGIAGKVFFVGFDATEKLIEAMKHGKIHGLMIQDPFAMGYQGVRTAVSFLRGEHYEKQIDTRIVMVTLKNMENTDVKCLLFPDISSYLDK